MLFSFSTKNQRIIQLGSILNQHNLQKINSVENKKIRYIIDRFSEKMADFGQNKPFCEKNEKSI